MGIHTTVFSFGDLSIYGVLRVRSLQISVTSSPFSPPNPLGLQGIQPPLDLCHPLLPFKLWPPSLPLVDKPS